MFGNVVFVVAHPDDQVVWCAGLIKFFKRSLISKVYVLSITKQDNQKEETL